jgi:hypothetical protein
MQGSPLPREARRRPDLDLLAGPLEAAAADSAAAPAPELTLLELPELNDAPMWRDDG